MTYRFYLFAVKLFFNVYHKAKDEEDQKLYNLTLFFSFVVVLVFVLYKVITSKQWLVDIIAKACK